LQAPLDEAVSQPADSHGQRALSLSEAIQPELRTSDQFMPRESPCPLIDSGQVLKLTPEGNWK
jgi:hypothetical protein